MSLRKRYSVPPPNSYLRRGECVLSSLSLHGGLKATCSGGVRSRVLSGDWFLGDSGLKAEGVWVCPSSLCSVAPHPHPEAAEGV